MRPGRRDSQPPPPAPPPPVGVPLQRATDEGYLKVEGTSRHQPQLAELAGGVMEPEGVYLEVPAALMPEWHGGRRVAVAVHLLDGQGQWWRVGELAPAVATAYWSALQWLRDRNQYGICVAHIKGGFLKESGEWAYYGVDLDLTAPGQMLVREPVARRGV
jgi:hypothetical protein